MSQSDSERRKQLSFLQAEGRDSLPAMQTGLKVTQRFRVIAYDVLIEVFGYGFPSTGGSYPTKITKFIWTRYFNFYSDDLPYDSDRFNKFIKQEIENDGKLLDLIQFCARTEVFNARQYVGIQKLLTSEMIGYRLLGAYGRKEATLFPVSDEDEAKENLRDFSELSDHESSRKHFIQAVEEIKSGHFRGSVTESISGVESVIKTLSGKSTVSLGEGLNILSKTKPLHPALKKGLDSIYGWTNSPSGMRHALSDEAEEVGEAEARYMLSACLAFAAWLKRASIFSDQ